MTVRCSREGSVTTWTYDQAYRLTNEHRAGGPTGTSFNHTHTYDPARNRTVLTADGMVTTFGGQPAGVSVITSKPLMLEPHDEVVGVSDDDHIARRVTPTPLVHPQVQDVEQVDVRKKR